MNDVLTIAPDHIINIVFNIKHVRRADGSFGDMQKIVKIYRAKAHTYFVGQERWLVHNCGEDEKDLQRWEGEGGPASSAHTVSTTDQDQWNAFAYKLLETLEGHLNEYDRPGNQFRPWMRVREYSDWRYVAQEIMNVPESIPDPEGYPGFFRWDVEGTFTGSQGKYELVVDSVNKKRSSTAEDGVILPFMTATGVFWSHAHCRRFRYLHYSRTPERQKWSLTCNRKKLRIDDVCWRYAHSLLYSHTFLRLTDAKKCHFRPTGP